MSRIRVRRIGIGSSRSLALKQGGGARGQWTSGADVETSGVFSGHGGKKAVHSLQSLIKLIEEMRQGAQFVLMR